MLDCAGCGVRLKETPFCRDHMFPPFCRHILTIQILCRMGCWFDKPFLQDGPPKFSTKWLVGSTDVCYKMGWGFCSNIPMAKMPFLQNGLQARSKSTFNINALEGACSLFVETNSWGVHTHFVAGAHFILENGVPNPNWSIGMNTHMLLLNPASFHPRLQW